MMTDRTKLTLSDMRNTEASSNLSITTDGAGGYQHTLISGGGTHDAVAIRGVNVVNWPPTASGQTFVYDGSVWAPGTISGGGGATTFLQLTDTPSSYTSASGYYVAVKDTEDGLEFTFATPSSGIQGVDVQKDDVEEVSLATILNFEGGAVQSITDEGGGKATIWLTASGSTALGELSNVTVQDHPQILDNEVLAWDSPSQLWINQQAGEAGLSVAGHTHQHDYLTNILIDDHHPRDHAVDGSTHTLASSTSGYIMQAHSASTFGFTPLLAQDLPSHTHVEVDITDLDHDAVKIQGETISAVSPASGQILKYDGTQWFAGTASGIGATTFLQLDDTPSTYTGQGGRYLLVDQGESALEFVAVPSGVEGIGIYDEGVFKASGVMDLDFVGEGVTATVTDSVATITISGTDTHDAVALRGVSIVSWTPSASGVVLTYDGSVWGPAAASGINGISVEEGGSEKISEATILNFVSGATVTDAGSGKANITVSGGTGNGGGAEILEVQIFS